MAYGNQYSNDQSKMLSGPCKVQHNKDLGKLELPTAAKVQENRDPVESKTPTVGKDEHITNQDKSHAPTRDAKNISTKSKNKAQNCDQDIRGTCKNAALNYDNKSNNKRTKTQALPDDQPPGDSNVAGVPPHVMKEQTPAFQQASSDGVSSDDGWKPEHSISHDCNTNGNPCSLKRPKSFPAMCMCKKTSYPKPNVKFRCSRGWLDDLRRLGVINMVGDLLCLLTMAFLMLGIAEYFLCPDPTADLKEQASNGKEGDNGRENDKLYFFCSSTCDAEKKPDGKHTPPHEEEPQNTTEEHFLPRALDVEVA